MFRTWTPASDSRNRNFSHSTTTILQPHSGARCLPRFSVRSFLSLFASSVLRFRVRLLSFRHTVFAVLSYNANFPCSMQQTAVTSLILLLIIQSKTFQIFAVTINSYPHISPTCLYSAARLTSPWRPIIVEMPHL